MTPEEHRDAANLGHGNMTDGEIAQWHATMGILESLLQMDICDHRTRGFCKDCVRNEFFGYPISVKDVSGS